MTNFSIVFMNFTWVLFPIMAYIIYETYCENINTKKTDLFLNFCLISSIYLIMRCGTFFNNTYILGITFDTIILILYVKKHYFSAIGVSIIAITYLKFNFNAEIFIIIFKFLTYYLLYIIYKNKQKIYIMLTFITRFLCLISMIIIKNIKSDELIEYLFYYIVTYFIIIFLFKAEKIIEINTAYKELKKENQLRESLFKISHEIKNPIAVCKGYLDMMNPNKPEQVEKYIPIIKSEIDKTLNILQDFSACNKIKIEHEIIDISVLLEEIVSNFSLLFDSKKIDFIADIPDDEIYINGDYNRLNQVLLNIIKNSIEAKDENKKSYIKLYTETNNKNIKIYIEDNGIGISKENLERVKEPFFTTKKTGTGLGIVLSNEIITAHKGKINYESEENVGTKVTVTIPIQE